MKLDIPNLDAMDPASLFAWQDACTSESPTARQAKRYATLKARAWSLRLSGHISAAMANEAECDAIYSRMSKRYRW